MKKINLLPLLTFCIEKTKKEKSATHSKERMIYINLVLLRISHFTKVTFLDILD